MRIVLAAAALFALLVGIGIAAALVLAQTVRQAEDDDDNWWWLIDPFEEG